jgi:hypothetical protein
MLPEQSKQTQLVARVARRLIGSNMDIPEVVNIKWSVRVIVSYYYFENLYNFFHLNERMLILKMVNYCYKKNL